MRTSLAFLAFLLVVAPAEALPAQGSAVGAIEGTIRERSAVRSVLAARVSVRRVEPDTTVSATAAPDATGRFRLDSLPPGRYRARLVSRSLDSLRVAPESAEVQIGPGRVVIADFTLPSSRTLRDLVCGDARLADRTAAVAGRAIDADADDRPLAGAELVATWMEFPGEGSSRGSMPTRHVAVVQTGPAGEYRICGVPTERLFSLQLRDHGHVSPLLWLLMANDEGAIARDLSLSARSAPTIAALDSLTRAPRRSAAGGEVAELQTVGTSELAGTVRGLSGDPIAGAHVRVRHARASTLSDSAGHFVLSDVPAGTQVLVVSHPGFTLAEVPVEPRPGRRVDQNVLLVRPLTLDAIETVELEAFDVNRRTNPYGQFLTQGQIDGKKHAEETIDLFDDVLGFTVFGRGPSARVISNLALANRAACSEASVIIHGGQGHRVNDVTPHQVAAIEAYADPAFVPARFIGQADCGVVVIWLRKISRPTVRPAVGLGTNGYP